MTFLPEIIGIELKCEADCPATATTDLVIHDQPFRFCDHHAAKIAAQLTLKAAADIEMVSA